MTSTDLAPPPASSPAAPRIDRRWWAILLIAFAVGFVLRGVVASTDAVPSVDETAYLRAGVSFWEGDGYTRDGEPELHFPPGVPVLAGGLARIAGDEHQGMVLLTWFTGALTVFPVAGIALRIAGRRAALHAAWLAAFVPALALLPGISGGGSEAPYALALASAVFAALLVDRDRRPAVAVAAAVGAGAAIGAGYLMRPEGLLVSLVLLAVIVVRRAGGLRALLQGPALRRALVPAGAFILTMAAFVMPYVSFLHTHTGRWEPTAKSQDLSMEAWRAVAENDRATRDRILYAVDETGLGFDSTRHSLTSLARENPGEYLSLLRYNATEAAGTIFGWDTDKFGPLWVPIWTLLPLPMVLVGMVGVWRRRRDPSVQAVVLVALIPLLTNIAFFVQPRYMVAPAVLWCALAGVGLAEIPQRWSRIAWGTFAAMTLLTTAATLHSNSNGWLHPVEPFEARRTGEWLAANTDPDDRIMTRAMITAFYAQRQAVAPPSADWPTLLRFARHYGVRYFVVEESTAARLRPEWKPLLEDVPVVPSGLRLVETIGASGRRARVFALDPPPEPQTGRYPGLYFVGDAG